MEPALEHRIDTPGYLVMSSLLGGLRPAVRYSLRLVAINRAGKSPASDPLLFTTLEEPPGAPPHSIRVNPAGGPGELLVSWVASALESWNSELTGYVVMWRELDVASASAERREGSACVRGTTATELVVRGLRGGTRHAVTVRAYSRAGVSPPAPLVYTTTPEGVPEDPPDAVSCEATGAHALRVRWAPPVYVSARGPTGYDVRLIPVIIFKPWEQQDISPSLEESAATGELMVHGLRAATNYSVWVRARSDLEAGPPATAVYCTTFEDVPGVVREMRAVPVAATAVLVTWEAPVPCVGRLTHYTLYIRELGKAGNEWSQRVEPDEGTQSDGAQREIRSLKENVAYEFWVVAATAAGTGPPSRPVIATPAHILGALVTWAERTVVVAAGARVRLRCAASGSPPLRWRWTAPPSAPPAVRLLSHSNTPELLLNKVEVSWSGNYTCSVRNSVGGDSVYLLLSVLGPPAAPVLHLMRADTYALHVGWDASPGLNSPAPVLRYSVRWVQAGEEEKREDGKERVVPAGDTTLLLSGLRCGVLYSVTVRAHSALSDSPHSTSLSARTVGDRPLALSGKEALWVNSTALRVNLMGWARRCPVERWLVELRRTDSSVWAALRIDAFSAQAEDLLPASWYDVRVTAESTAGETVALYRVATLTPGGDRIGETIEVPTEERRTAVMGGTRIGAEEGEGLVVETGAVGAWHSRLLLVSTLVASGLTALLVALIGTALVRRHNAQHDHSALQERLPHPQLYTTEPCKRNGKTTSEPEAPRAAECLVCGAGELREISPYATFSMSGAPQCELHLRPALPGPAHRPRPHVLPHSTGFSSAAARDTDSESSGSPCAACADQLYRVRRATPDSGAEDASHCALSAAPLPGDRARRPTAGRHCSAPAGRYSMSSAVQAGLAPRTPP